MPEANSSETGGRPDVVGFHPTCVGCHELGALDPATHVAGLDSPGFGTDPVDTLRSGLGFDDTSTPPTCLTSIADCHTNLPGVQLEWTSGPLSPPHVMDLDWLPTGHVVASMGDPACIGCHKLSAPFSDASRCDSCHWFATQVEEEARAEDWPSNLSRPNRQGDHDEGAHARVCSTCHAESGEGYVGAFRPIHSGHCEAPH